MSITTPETYGGTDNSREIASVGVNQELHQSVKQQLVCRRRFLKKAFFIGLPAMLVAGTSSEILKNRKNAREEAFSEHLKTQRATMEEEGKEREKDMITGSLYKNENIFPVGDFPDRNYLINNLTINELVSLDEHSVEFDLHSCPSGTGKYSFSGGIYVRDGSNDGGEFTILIECLGSREANHSNIYAPGSTKGSVTRVTNAALERIRTKNPAMLAEPTQKRCEMLLDKCVKNPNDHTHVENLALFVLQAISHNQHTTPSIKDVTTLLQSDVSPLAAMTERP